MAEEPFKREETTLRKVKDDPAFSCWYAKVTDGEEPFIISLEMFFSQYESESDPEWDIERVAFFNASGSVVLLVGYPSMPVITLLSGGAALEYLYNPIAG